MTLFTFNIIKIFVLAALSALIGMIFAPILIRFLNKIKFWKKEGRKKAISGEDAEVFYSLHKEREVSRPRGGGFLIWISILVLIILFFLLAKFSGIWWLKRLDFLSRNETWLPLFTLVAGSIVGLFDDILQVFGSSSNNNEIKKPIVFKLAKSIFLWISGRGKYIGGGMRFTRRLIIIILIGLIGGLWFYYKLGWNSVHIPLIFNFPIGIDLNVGIWIIPLFILVMVACWSGGIVDGLDGLSGGVFASIFGAFSIIAFSLGKVDLAVFCAVIFGSLFAFLWYNIPPARFYMGETGILGLTSTMAVVAFLTDSIVVLPIVAGLLVIEVGSVILQLLSKRFRHKKIWLSTPIHHHFEAKGWPPYQIKMRFWIISIIFAILGVVIRLLG
jgi:phospho-N-acetylmuramoyl-pentapeptide-transferase